MDARHRHIGLGIVLGTLGLLVLAFVAALVVAYTGAYNIAASSGHTAGMRWVLDTTLRNAVGSRAPDAAAARLAAADLEAGAGEYKSMCQHCHGGAGVEPADWSRGMLPRPPHLVEEAREWKPGEVFWIVKHGLKYTGMPAFGETHDDATLWNIAAFVDQLPAMTPERYRMLGASHSHGGDGGHGGHGDHGDAASSARPDITDGARQPAGARPQPETGDSAQDHAHENGDAHAH